ncbi:major facilitator superfamily domain-containing protein [Suillus subalutaceus]|uniref:major facilitator superfamily domain-containing protein n=1 Tax=Suillus subalutaceus TaxID=48586 RepID=UPI001B88624D|nr:major facilitator superfamily domain-containing protein [Suillus subalutaceus]KAG1846603.1 major facilitator superfamily domain-containing protein [Suillus subalutaceus]
MTRSFFVSATMSISEESPLLDALHVPDASGDCDVYDRFTKAQKNFIIFVVSFAGLLPTLVTGTFVPSIPQIAHDLDSKGAVVSLAVSLSVFANAIGGLVWAAYSSFYGRRPMYLWGMPILCIGSFGVAASMSLRTLLFWRFVQAFGCAGGVSVGAAVIGDIYRPEQRGTALGIFFGASLLGVALSPIIGGTAAHYWSWRNLHFSLGIWGVIEMVLIYLSFPETSHPQSGEIRKLAALSNHPQLGETRKLTLPFNFVLINPFNSLWLLRSPNIMAVTLANASAMVTDYVLLVPIAYTIGARYHISNEALIGACFLPSGLGNFIASPIAGRLSDTMISKWKVKRNGIWVPEDRLRAVLVGGLLVPLSVGLSGLVTAYIAGPLGLVLNLLCLFLNGIGVDFVLTPIGSYNVDVLQSRSAEVIAAVTAFRAIILAPVTAAVLPSIEMLGVAGTNGIATVIALVGYGLIVLTIRYGGRMRAWVDVGYTPL